METGNFKYFYNSLGHECGNHDLSLTVASEKSISESKEKGVKYIMAFVEGLSLKLSSKKVKIGEVVGIIFGYKGGTIRSANELEKLSRRGANLPDFIRARKNKIWFAVYKFPDGQKVVLRESYVYQFG